MSDDDPTPLRAGLERFFRHLGAPPVDVLAELGSRWEEIVGPGLAGPTRPIELLDGVLVVGCDDAAWASQIGWMEAQIRARFADVFPEVTVAGIRTRVDR